MDTFDREREMLGAFWDFLAYLQRYVELAKSEALLDTDPARTRLLSTLIECMRPVLHADLAFVGYRNLEDDPGDWVQIVKETSKIGRNVHQRSSLIGRMEDLDWRLPYDQLTALQFDHPVMLFDQGLEKTPLAFQGVVTALAISRVVLSGRDYFLFFCDVEKKAKDYPRYDGFDRTMLAVATGILDVGFQSGVRRGKEAQQAIEEAQTRQFLSDLVHELKTPVQAVVADANNLQDEMPADWTELREIATRNLNAARHLSSVIDSILLTLAGSELPGETPVMLNIEKPVQEAITMLSGEAQAKGLEIRKPVTVDGHPFPELPLYPGQLIVAFKNLIHNAITYSLSEESSHMPIEIVGYHSGEGYYTVDIVNYGIEITNDEIKEDLLFKLRYRGEKARQLSVSGSGLGLTSAQRVVEKHGGRIEVTSMPVGSGIFRNTFSIIVSTRLHERSTADEQNTLG
jgi:signal transduction histidine kinase